MQNNIRKTTLSLLGALVFLLASASSMAQGDQLGEITFEELKDKEQATSYFALGGGFVARLLNYKNDNINKLLPAEFRIKDFSAPMLLSGGEGFVTPTFIKNLRIGFSALGGTQTVDSTTPSKEKIQVDFSSSFNGLCVDYAIPIVKSLTILPGIQGGFGVIRFERYGGVDKDSWAWDTSKGSRTRMSRIEASQLFFEPSLDIEYAISSFAMLRANVGYSMTFNGTWKLNRTTELSDAPADLKSTGMFFGFGLFVGLFRNE